jgi:hypothetical protein
MFTSMATERVSVKLPDGFDPNRHIAALKRKIGEAHEGFELSHIDMQAGYAYATRESAILEVAENVETETFEVKLPKGAKPSDGDRQAARLEDQYPGYYLVKFEPFLGKATLAALSPAAVRCRLAVSVALGVKAWDVQIAERTDGGFDLKLPDTYVPSKHDDKLTEVAEAVVGQLGWTFRSNPSKLTASIDPGDPPTFEPVLPYPFAAKVPRFDPTKPDWARLPLGEILGGKEYVSDFGASPHRLISGTSGSGKSIALQAIISGALARGWELVIVDAVKGGVDFAPFQPYVRPSGWGCETLEEAVTALDLAYKEGARRKELVKRHQVQKWTELPADLGIKPVLVITDEVSSFLILETVPKLAKDNPLVLEVQARNACKSMAGILLGKIARELRYVGIHLVVSSQVSQSATGVSTELRSNLGEKLLLGVNPTDGNRRLALNAADQVPRVPPYIAKDPKVGRGCGVFEREGDPPYGVLKGYFATMGSFTDWLVKLGVPTTERTRPTASEVAKSTPAQDMPEERTPRQPKGVPDGGMNVRSGSSMDEAFRATETCATCGVPIDPATGNCRCSW